MVKADEYYEEDLINQPPHYMGRGVEVIEVIEAFDLGFHLGNAVKYILRAGAKRGETKRVALQKARWYINRELERSSG